MNNIDILSSYDHIWSRKLCLLAGSVCFLAMARLQWPVCLSACYTCTCLPPLDLKFPSDSNSNSNRNNIC